MTTRENDSAGVARPVSCFTALLRASVLAPWNAAEYLRDVPDRWVASWAIVQWLLASALSALLSSWIYLAGKGLFLGWTEMDMGQDDLPPDSVAQVFGGLVGSFLTWAVLLALVLALCVVVADTVYSYDRARFRTAVRTTCAASLWIVVWAAAVLAANAKHHDELKRPLAAIRAYAQLRQQGFQGSSAVGPGPLEVEPLAGHHRLASLVVLFPLVWALGLPTLGMPTSRRWLTIMASIALWWVLCGAIGRLLPWISIDAVLG